MEPCTGSGWESENRFHAILTDLLGRREWFSARMEIDVQLISIHFLQLTKLGPANAGHILGVLFWRDIGISCPEPGIYRWISDHFWPGNFGIKFWLAGERLKNHNQSPVAALVLVIPLVNLGFLLYLLLTPEPKAKEISSS